MDTELEKKNVFKLRSTLYNDNNKKKRLWCHLHTNNYRKREWSQSFHFIRVLLSFNWPLNWWKNQFFAQNWFLCKIVCLKIVRNVLVTGWRTFLFLQKSFFYVEKKLYLQTRCYHALKCIYDGENQTNTQRKKNTTRN